MISAGLLQEGKGYAAFCHCEGVHPTEAIYMRQYFVYIMTNYGNSVLYTGVTNDLIRRVYEHKNKLIKSFTSKYNINKLVYYEVVDNIESAILREKQLKAGSRQKKVNLINKLNPKWEDLYKQIIS